MAAADVAAETGDAAEMPPLSSKLVAAASLAPMLDRIMPSVVSILVEGQHRRPCALDAGGAELKPSVTLPFRAGGSGVVIDAERGLIITNNHVISDATHVNVSLLDGRIAEARVIGTDVATDVAVLQTALPNLEPIQLGDLDKLRVGDFIVAIGAPYGLEGSASQGIVSALMRTNIGYEIFEDFIQIDAGSILAIPAAHWLISRDASWGSIPRRERKVFALKAFRLPFR